MGDIQDLKELVAQQFREGVQAQKRSEEAEKRNEDSQKRFDDLLAEMARLPAAAPVAAAAVGPGHGHIVDSEVAAAVADVAALVARADKISKLGITLRKKL